MLVMIMLMMSWDLAPPSADPGMTRGWMMSLLGRGLAGAWGWSRQYTPFFWDVYTHARALTAMSVCLGACGTHTHTFVHAFKHTNTCAHTLFRRGSLLLKRWGAWTKSYIITAKLGFFTLRILINVTWKQRLTVMAVRGLSEHKQCLTGQLYFIYGIYI